MPLVTSTTSNIVSMICAPPMTVRMSEAWPGQSTSVNCSTSAASPASAGGNGTQKDEKPRSSVIPRSLLCGFLSSAAVDSWVDSAATAARHRRQSARPSAAGQYRLRDHSQ